MQYTTNYSLKKPQYADEADIEVINDNTDDVDTLIHQNRTMIAPAFDNTKAYVTGDPVEYLGALYVFTADKAAGAWDASKVEPTTAAEMGGGGASAIADLDDVEITSPTQGQALVYDDTDDIWKNATLPEPVDVEANPSASSTATLSKLKVGSTVYGVSGLPSTSSASNGDVLTLGSGKTPTWASPAVGGDGVTIDTSTVITSGNIAEYGALNYTATQDCFVAFCVYPKSGYTTYIKINNVTIKSFYGNFGNSDGLPYEDCIFLKTGQALYVNNNANYQGSYHVYGVQEINSAVVAQLNAMKTGFDGVVYDSPAAMVQGSDEFLYKQINDFNLYNAISTKSKFGGDLYPGDIILVNYTGGTYNYKWVDLNLSAGDYTIVVGHIDFSPVGSLKIKNAVVGTNILNITSSGAYKFTVSAGYSGTNGILFQVSEGSETTSGIYGAYNIHIFSGDVTKAPVFANDVIGKRPPAKKISKHFDSVSGYEGGNIQVGNSKQNNTIGFYGKFTGTFNGIQIMHGVNKPYASGVVQVYSDRIEVYKHTNAQTLIATYQHGLTLSTFIELKINVLEDQKATITLGTLGGVYHVDNVEFDGCYNSIAWNTITTAMTDCEISYSDNDKNKEIWLFGDSYMDHYPVYMHEYGADNFALDGFSGRTSTEALYSLNIALQNCPIPKYLIWALGMNDGDTGGTVNANWKSVFDTVKSYCDMYEIELIPVTVPNTPTVDNSYKNAVIRSSGLRYVDLSDAVGAEESTSWYTGLLSGDNVHATPQGRKVMALRMMADVPELV